MRNDDIKPDWRYILIDETRYWCDDKFIAECGGKLVGAYVFDANRAVHCCELTPSFELLLIETLPRDVPQDDAGAERVLDAIRDADRETDLVSYVHCYSINTDKCVKSGYEPDEDVPRDTQDDEVVAYAVETGEHQRITFPA